MSVAAASTAPEVLESISLTEGAPDWAVPRIVAYLSAEAYWSQGIARERVVRSLRNSLCVTATQGDTLVGFARVVTDRATFAYLCDVFVEPAFRGHGVATGLVQWLQAHPELQGLRRWLLGTRDSHHVYAGVGFVPLAAPERFMEIHRPYAVDA